MKISVGIVTRNRQRLLRQCIVSVLENSIKPDEIIIIDNNSSDTTIDIIQDFKRSFPHISYYFENRVGRPFAREKLFSIFRGEVLALIDDDCRADKNWIKHIKKAFVNPNTEAIQGEAVSHHTNKTLERIIQTKHDCWFKRNLIKNQIFTIDTKNCAFRKNIIKIIRLDESLCGEDIDIAMQLQSKNIKIYFDKKMIVHHYEKGIFELIKQSIRNGRFHFQINRKWLLREKGRIVYPKYPIVGKIVFRIPFKLGFYFEKIKSLNSIKDTLKYKLPRLTQEPVKKDLKHLKVSVLIITKDRFNGMNSLLKSLSKQLCLPYEIIIIDSSKDCILKNILPKFNKLNIVYYHTKSVGYSTCRNIGMKMATGEIIAIADDDCIVKNDWIKNIQISHSKNQNNVVIIGKTIKKSNNKIIERIENLDYTYWLANSIDHNNDSQIITALNSSYKLKQFRKIGLLFRENSNINRYGGEDVDLARRLILNNFSIKFDPNIKLIHHERGDFLSYIKQQIRKIKTKKYLNKKSKNDFENTIVNGFIKMLIVDKDILIVYIFISTIKLFVYLFLSNNSNKKFPVTNEIPSAKTFGFLDQSKNPLET